MCEAHTHTHMCEDVYPLGIGRDGSVCGVVWCAVVGCVMRRCLGGGQGVENEKIEQYNWPTNAWRDQSVSKQVLLLRKHFPGDQWQEANKAYVTIPYSGTGEMVRCNILHYTVAHCNTLQHTAAHCDTLSHTATHATHGNTR